MSCTTLTDKDIKARKEHICIWCGEKILIKEIYNYWSGIYEGEMQSNRMHLECRDAFVETLGTFNNDGVIHPESNKRGSTEER